MITKTQIISTLQGLPKEMTIDQLIDNVIFVEKVQNGLNDSKTGKIHSKEQTKKKLSKWLK